MVRIRLRRIGAKKKPTYRVVVADSRSPRDGRFIETIGHYDPRTDPPTVVIKEARAIYWLSVGAQPSEAVQRFFDKLSLKDKLAKVRGGASIDAVAEEPPAPAAQPAKAKAGAKAEPAKAQAKAKADEAAAVETEAAAEAAEPVAEAPAQAEAAPTEAAEPEADAAAAAAAAEAEAEAEPEAEAEAPAAEPETEPAAAGASPDGLAALGLSTRVVKALEEAGVGSVGQLRELADQGEDQLSALPGIGAKAVEEIVAALQGQG